MQASRACGAGGGQNARTRTRGCTRLHAAARGCALTCPAPCRDKELGRGVPRQRSCCTHARGGGVRCADAHAIGRVWEQIGRAVSAFAAAVLSGPQSRDCQRLEARCWRAAARKGPLRRHCQRRLRASDLVHHLSRHGLDIRLGRACCRRRTLALRVVKIPDTGTQRP